MNEVQAQHNSRKPDSSQDAPSKAEDPWRALRRYTNARIALGRVGASLPTDEVLRFGMARA